MVAVVAFDGVVLGDLSTACEVFGLAKRKDGRAAYDVRVCSESADVESMHVALRAPWRLSSLARADTVIVPGVNDVTRPVPASVLRGIRRAAVRGARVASICTGAFILAAAGLLHQRRVTTHWLFSEALARAYPSIDVDASLLFARDGNIYSSGGITAGIDLALALVEEDLGREIALATARTVVVFPHRPGGQSQFSAHVKFRDVRSRPDLEELQAWILGNPGEDLSVEALADRMGMSPRNFARLFRSETGDTPAQFADRARGPTRPAANSNKALCRSRPSPSNAASAIPNACGAPFSAFSRSVRTTTGRGFDQPC